MRIDGRPGTELDQARLHLSLHPADFSFRTQRKMMHRGIFVGINGIIALLALVIGWRERQRTAWLLVFLLSVVSVLDIVSDLAGDTDLLGMSEEVQHGMYALNLLLLPWGPYLLIRLLGEMGAGLTARRNRLYLVGAVVVSLMVALFLVAKDRDLVDDTNGLTLINDQPWVVIPGLVLFGIVFAINSAVHSYLILAYSDFERVAMNVGFYYMANAGGRLAGTVLSGLAYQVYGLEGCLWLSALALLAALLLSLKLPEPASAPEAAVD